MFLKGKEILAADAELNRRIEGLGKWNQTQEYLFNLAKKFY